MGDLWITGREPYRDGKIEQDSLVLGVGIAFLSWVGRIGTGNMAMPRGGWREFVDGGSSIARYKGMGLDQGGAIGAGVIRVGVGVRMLLLVMLVMVMVVRMGGALTRN